MASSQGKLASPQRVPGPDWEELRIALAVARAGSLVGAARALGVAHSTVFRRLAALERRIGARLFDRRAGAYVATAAGARAALAAERMEAEAQAIDRELAGGDARLEGRIRVTASETLAYRALARHLAAFRARHPGILVELAIDNRLFDLSRREADVALRARRPREAALFGRRLGDIAWAAYGPKADAHALPRRAADLARHPVIGWGEANAPMRVAAWLDAHVPDAAVVFRTSSLVNQMVAAREGLGLAVLPCYLGDPEPGLVRAFGPIAGLATELWLVTHRDLAGTARIRAFMSEIGEALARERSSFAGRAARQPRA